MNAVAPRLMFVVNNPAFFVSHRLPVALAARRAGYDVSVAGPSGDGVGEIVRAGLPFHPVPIARGAASPVSDSAALVGLVRLFRRSRPDIVHAVTLKPVVFAGIAARLARVPCFVGAIAGLGYTFIDRDAGASRLRPLVEALFRIALRHPRSRVIFQNTADRDALVAMGAVAPANVRMIGGSGVDLDLFRPAPEAPGPRLVVLPSRMLRDKGVAEFIAAAGAVKAAGINARFALVGDIDPANPASCTAAELDAAVADGAVEWWGFRPDMAAVLAAAHLVVLPSYREGFPKALMEAAAAGRAVVTTDVPGCRDAIEPGITGLTVPARDAGALADAIATLLQDDARRASMASDGRALAERAFGIEAIVTAHLDIYRELSLPRVVGTAASVAAPL